MGAGDAQREKTLGSAFVGPLLLMTERRQTEFHLCLYLELNLIVPLPPRKVKNVKRDFKCEEFNPPRGEY